MTAQNTKDEICAYIDGSSLGNPGNSGIGVVLVDKQGRVLAKLKKYLGETTNNVAEYAALIYAMQEANKRGIEHLRARTDSELLAKQMNGQYKVRNERLKMLHSLACQRAERFKSFRIEHLSRNENKQADSLAFSAANSKSEKRVSLDSLEKLQFLFSEKISPKDCRVAARP